MREWLDILDDVTRGGNKAVLVTIAHVRGSSPREAGAHMVVTADRQFLSIGGGRLEHRAIAESRRILRDQAMRPQVKDYPLGPALGQCCGGVVTLVFEPVAMDIGGWIRDHLSRVESGQVFASVLDLNGSKGRLAVCPTDNGTAGISVMAEPAVLRSAYRIMELGETDRTNLLVGGRGDRSYLVEHIRDERTPLYLFGAGHVGQALVRMLEGLPFRVTWIDSRAGYFPALPQGVRALSPDNPEDAVADAPANAFYLVMTHDHGQDFEICAAVLARGDAAFAGVIGSDTKRARFEKRLKERGIEQKEIDNLVCPIGIDGISGKRPVEVALAVAAQMQLTHEALSTGNREDECEANRESTE